ncbi:unnamed protein product, partial [Choristocarpus tenellus]
MRAARDCTASYNQHRILAPPTADTSFNERCAYDEYVRHHEALWFMLGQATRGAAAMVVSLYGQHVREEGSLSRIRADLWGARCESAAHAVHS